MHVDFITKETFGACGNLKNVELQSWNKKIY